MNDDESKNAVRDHDYKLGVVMAYFSELTTTAHASQTLPGSEMHAHLQDYTNSQQHLNPAYLSWRSIASAGEHAGFAEHMRYVTGGGVVMRPQTTLARATLLGAARALYVLLPDSKDERAIRAAKLANQEANDAKKMLDAWDEQTNVPADMLRDLQDQTKELADDAGQVLTAAGLNPKSTINESTMLKEVVAQIPSAPAEAEEEVLALWNRLSGVSHARSWIWNTPYGISPQFDFIDTWTIPVDLLANAWRLWNQRRGDSSIPNLPSEEWHPNRSRWNG